MGQAAASSCGLLLITAAGLKLYGLNFSPFAQYGQLHSPLIQTAAVAWEILLGVWLLTGAYRFLSWLAAVNTFLAFAGLSGYLGLIGQANCGCFGVIKASPWAAFAVDISALGLLALGRPAWGGWAANRSGVRWIAGVALLMAVLSGLGVAKFGSLEAALVQLRGHALGVTPPVLDFGAGKSGDRLTAIVTVRNWTDDTVRILGGTSDCSCTATQNLPVRIDPGGQAEIAVVLIPPSGNGGHLTRSVYLLTDCAAQPTIWLTATCRLEE